jgi:hypothetical protein
VVSRHLDGLDMRDFIGGLHGSGAGRIRLPPNHDGGPESRTSRSATHAERDSRGIDLMEALSTISADSDPSGKSPAGGSHRYPFKSAKRIAHSKEVRLLPSGNG